MKKLSVLLFITFIITTLIMFMNGCGNKIVDTQPNIINSGSSLAIQVEWPNNPLNSVRKAPPAYLGLATIEVFLIEKDFANTIFDSSFLDNIDNPISDHYTAPKRTSVVDTDVMSSIRGTEYEDKLYFYSFDVTSHSTNKDGAKIENISVGDYVLILFGIQNGDFVSTYAMKNIGIQENQSSSVTITEYDWIINNSTSPNSITLINGNYTTATQIAVSLSLDRMNPSEITVDEGSSSFSVTYNFTYDGEPSDLEYIATCNFVTGTTTPDNGLLTLSNVTTSPVPSGTNIQATFTITNISTLSIPTDATGKSGFNIGFQIIEKINGLATGATDWNNFTIFIQDSNTNQSPSLNLLSFAINSVFDFDFIKYHGGLAGEMQDPRINASPINTIQGATIDLSLNSDNTNQNLIIVYDDSLGMLSPISYSTSSMIPGTDYKLYKADDLSKTDISGGIFPTAFVNKTTGELSIEIPIVPGDIDAEISNSGYGSYILEIITTDGDNIYNEKFHLFFEKGLYVNKESDITSLNYDGEISTSKYSMGSATNTGISGGNGNFTKGNVSLVDFSTSKVNGFTRFDAVCGVNTHGTWVLTIPIDTSTSNGLNVLDNTNITDYAIGFDNAKNDS
ncbi:MAG: hypothetical protein M0Q02_12435, partial [Candidatus Muirbacterium halophilum]|nr:hypothetical protein [Candidatus Muirbacterium halophilum]